MAVDDFNMGDGGPFPSVQYVPIEHGGGGDVLSALMGLYKAYNQSKQDKNTDFYLAHHGPPGVNNQGDMAGAKQMADYGNINADSAMRTASGAADTQNAASRATEVTDEGKYQQGELVDAANRLTQQKAQDAGILANDTTRTRDQQQNSQGLRMQAMQDEEDKLEGKQGDQAQKGVDQQNIDADRKLNHYLAWVKTRQDNPDFDKDPTNVASYNKAATDTGYPTLPSISSPGTGTGAGVSHDTFGGDKTTPAANAPVSKLNYDVRHLFQPTAEQQTEEQRETQAVTGNDPLKGSLLGSVRNFLSREEQPVDPNTGQPVQPQAAAKPTPQEVQGAYNVLAAHGGVKQPPGTPTPTPEHLAAMAQLMGAIHQKITGMNLRPVEENPRGPILPNVDWQNPGEISAQPVRNQ